MPVQTGNRRYQRAHARRNPHRHVQDVIQQQRGGSQQTGPRSQVLFRDGIGATAAGIGRNGLPIRKEQHGQQEQDNQGYGREIRQSRRAERQQNRQRGFRAIRRGRERVQAEHRNTGENADFLLLFFMRGEVTAQNLVQQRHKAVFL